MIPKEAVVFVVVMVIVEVPEEIEACPSAPVNMLIEAWVDWEEVSTSLGEVFVPAGPDLLVGDEVDDKAPEEVVEPVEDGTKSIY